MDSHFWITAWTEGRTNFHQETFHKKLIEYFPQFNPRPGQKILVPLCGKSKDMLYLKELGLHVHGVELYETAVEDFFVENKLLPFHKTQTKNFGQYVFDNILLSCGDFFNLPVEQNYDFVFDRASLVALPQEMRKAYSKVISRALRVGGKCLLITYEYDQTKLSGPPFSVSHKEIQELYQNQFKIVLLEGQEAKKDGTKFSSLETLKQSVYILERN